MPLSLRRAYHPLVVIAGKMYGSGSSRDWAAKGPALLGVRAIIAESFERIHRSNLIGMGILPLEFMPGEGAETLGLHRFETFSIGAVFACAGAARTLDHKRARPRRGRYRYPVFRARARGHAHRGRISRKWWYPTVCPRRPRVSPRDRPFILNRTL